MDSIVTNSDTFIITLCINHVETGGIMSKAFMYDRFFKFTLYELFFLTRTHLSVFSLSNQRRVWAHTLVNKAFIDAYLQQEYY